MPQIKLPSEKLVRDHFRGILRYESDLEEKAENDSYWDSCLVFWNEMKEKPLAWMSEKQRSWLERIEEALMYE